MENFTALVKKNRSYRRFDESMPVSYEQMHNIASNIRFVPCGTNKQALKVLISVDADKNALIFPELGWAGLIDTWNGPGRGEKPTGYFVIVCDTAISKPKGRETDLGIAAQTLALAAAEQGLGVCMMASFSKTSLAEKLGLPGNLEPMLVIAVGVPAEKVTMVEMAPDGNTSYYRDRTGTHFVPKRPLSDLVSKL